MGRTRIAVAVFERTRTTVRGAGENRTQEPEGTGPRPFVRPLLVDLGIACVCAGVIMSALGARSPRLTELENERVEKMRRVARAELVSARAHATPEEVRRSVASLGALLQRRAAVALDPGVVDGLAALEQRTLDGRLGRVTVEEAGEIFAEVLCERIRDASDAEILSAADGFGNVIPVGRLEALGDDHETRFAVAKRLRGTSGELAAKRALQPPNGVILRGNGLGNMPAEAFVEELTELRARLRLPGMFMLVSAQASEYVGRDLDERVALIERAAPESWADARTAGLTPVQALLVAYLAASDDALMASGEELAELQQRDIGHYVRNVEGGRLAGHRAPYGRYGDLFSTPLDLVFDAGTLGALLDRIERKAASR